MLFTEMSKLFYLNKLATHVFAAVLSPSECWLDSSSSYFLLDEQILQHNLLEIDVCHEWSVTVESIYLHSIPVEIARTSHSPWITIPEGR